MKLQHNLGGLEGLGPVNFETRVFVEPWEERIFGIHVAMMGMSLHLSDSVAKYPIEKLPTKFKSTWTWADLRKGAEAMNPFDYFKYRYYEKWLGGIAGFFVSKGYISQKELDSRTAAILGGENPTVKPLKNDEIDKQIIEYLRVGDQGGREGDFTPAFAVGDSPGTEGMSEQDLAKLVTPESMMGSAKALSPA